MAFSHDTSFSNKKEKIEMKLTFIRKRVTRKRLNYFFVMLGITWFLLGVGELNNLLAHRIDFSANAPTLEVFSFLNWHWYLPEGAWYNTILWGMIGLGVAIIIVTFWFWTE